MGNDKYLKISYIFVKFKKGKIATEKVQTLNTKYILKKKIMYKSLGNNKIHQWQS